MSRRRSRKHPKNARRGRAGFTLGEMLVALIIVSLLSMSIATGISFATRQYERTLTRSEARILCSTLATVFREELSNTTCVDTSGAALGYLSKSYTPPERQSTLSNVLSVTKSEDGTMTVTDYGMLALHTAGSGGGGDIYTLILPPEAYAPQHALKAKASIEYLDDPSYGKNGIFKVEIRIRAGRITEDQVTSTFYVTPLNKPEAPDGGT